MTDDHQIIASLKEQLACYRKLQRLCELQRTYVQQNQTDELLRVLESRGGILSEIARLEHEVAPLKRNWAELSAKMSEELRGSVAGMIGETKLLLEQITQADQDDVLLLQQRKLNVGKQIQATTSARKINTRYAAAAYGNTGGSKLNVQQ